MVGRERAGQARDGLNGDLVYSYLLLTALPAKHFLDPEGNAFAADTAHVCLQQVPWRLYARLDISLHVSR